MKSRKSKLLITLSSFAIVFAVMIIAVSAATTQVINIITNVGFTATGVSGTVTANLTGVNEQTYYYNSDNTDQGTPIEFSPSTDALTGWTIGDQTAPFINVTDGIPSSVVYTFTITNSSSTEQIAVSIASITVGENLAVTSVEQDGEAVAATEGAYAFTDIASSGNTQIVVTIDVVDSAISFASQAISFSINLSKAIPQEG